MNARKKSKVWQHFTEVEENRVTCLLCGQRLSVSNKSTCSLIRHLGKKHPTVDIQKSVYYGKRMSTHVGYKTIKIDEQTEFPYPEDDSSSAVSQVQFGEEDDDVISNRSEPRVWKPKLYSTKLQNEIFNAANPAVTEQLTIDPLIKEIPLSYNEIQLTFQAYAASVQKLSTRRQTIIKYKVAKLIMLEELAEQEEYSHINPKLE